MLVILSICQIQQRRRARGVKPLKAFHDDATYAGDLHRADMAWAKQAVGVMESAVDNLSPDKSDLIMFDLAHPLGGHRWQVNCSLGRGLRAGEPSPTNATPCDLGTNHEGGNQITSGIKDAANEMASAATDTIDKGYECEHEYASKGMDYAAQGGDYAVKCRMASLNSPRASRSSRWPGRSWWAKSPRGR
jgi:hypothetical protein